MSPRFAPGPRGLPLAGSLFEFGKDQLGFLRGVAGLGDVVSFRLGPMRAHLLTSADLVREVLVERAGEFLQHPITREIFGRVLGNGILVSDGDFHRRQRRLTQPAFVARRIEGYAAAMVEEAERVADGWRPGAVLDLGAEMLRIAARIVARTLFGTDAVERAPVHEATRVLQTEASKLFRSVWIPPAWLPLPQNLRLRRATRQMEAVILAEIARRRAAPPAEDPEDLLSMLIHATDDEGGTGRMTDRQLRDEALTIFLPGFETAANGLTWLFYALSDRPALDAEIAAEARALGEWKPATGLAKRALPGLDLAERTVKEALRLWAPIWAYNRTPKHPLQVGGYDVLPGDLLILSPAVLHTQPRYFERPDDFDPDRFRAPTHPRHAYLPFGAGPHVCIGAQFATQEMVLVLAAITRRFRLALVPGQRVEPDALVSLRPRRPILVKAIPRDLLGA
jgi:cytochrome P450